MVIEDIFCGTRAPEQFDIHLDDYCERNKNSATEEDIELALKLFKNTIDNIDFAEDGHRNNDAVNCCIALHVLGYNPLIWFNTFFKEDEVREDNRFFICDATIFMEHVKRITPYVYKWGPKGNEGNALAFAL